MDVPPLAEVKGIDVHRGQSKVLESASVNVGAGEVVAVMGHNGSGKTTLIEAFAGILPLRSGEVIWTMGVRRYWSETQMDAETRPLRWASPFRREESAETKLFLRDWRYPYPSQESFPGKSNCWNYWVIGAYDIDPMTESHTCLGD